MLTVSPLCSPESRLELAKLMFDVFAVPALCMANQAVLSLYSTGRTTGIVLEMGEGMSYCVPVYEGFALRHAVLSIPVAGSDVTRFLMRNLGERGVAFVDSQADTVRDIKERLCRVKNNRGDYNVVPIGNSNAANAVAQASAAAAAAAAPSAAAASSSGSVIVDLDETSYELPSGQMIRLDDYTRFNTLEILFNPSVYAQAIYGTQNQQHMTGGSNQGYGIPTQHTTAATTAAAAAAAAANHHNSSGGSGGLGSSSLGSNVPSNQQGGGGGGSGNNTGPPTPGGHQGGGGGQGSGSNGGSFAGGFGGNNNAPGSAGGPRGNSGAGGNASGSHTSNSSSISGIPGSAGGQGSGLFSSSSSSTGGPIVIDLSTNDLLGVSTLLASSISMCDSFLRRDLMKNIVLAGGTSMAKGFGERMKRELAVILATAIKEAEQAEIEAATAQQTTGGNANQNSNQPAATVQEQGEEEENAEGTDGEDGERHPRHASSSSSLNVVTDSQRKYAAWIGASMYASLPTFGIIKITAEQYKRDENIVHKKFF